MTPRQLTLTAAALLASTSAARAALTFTQIVTTGPALKPISATQTFAPFNFAGFTLTSVVDTMTETFADTVSITNNSPIAASTEVKVIENHLKNFGGGAFTIAGSDSGGFNTGLLAGAGGSTSGIVSGSDSASATSAGAAALAAFTGPGNISAALTDSGSLATSGNTNVAIISVDKGTIVDKLQYIYTPSVTTPEPATLSLLGSGLIGLGLSRFARRRKR